MCIKPGFCTLCRYISRSHKNVTIITPLTRKTSGWHTKNTHKTRFSYFFWTLRPKSAQFFPRSPTQFPQCHFFALAYTFTANPSYCSRIVFCQLLCLVARWKTWTVIVLNAKFVEISVFIMEEIDRIILYVLFTWNSVCFKGMLLPASVSKE